MDEIRKSHQEELDRLRQLLKKARVSTDQAAAEQVMGTWKHKEAVKDTERIFSFCFPLGRCFLWLTHTWENTGKPDTQCQPSQSLALGLVKLLNCTTSWLERKVYWGLKSPRPSLGGVEGRSKMVEKQANFI